MDGVLNFFGSEAGQRRRAALADLSRNIGYYIPPELRGLLGAAAEMTPTSTLERAAQASERMFGPDRTASQRVGDLGAMLSETAGIAAPVLVAGRAAIPAAQAVQEGLLGFSMAAPELTADAIGTARAIRDLDLEFLLGRGDPALAQSLSAANARDPRLWHPASDIKLRMPVEEMQFGIAETGLAQPARTVDIADLQGEVLVPAFGDRTRAGGLLTSIGDEELSTPVPLQGGADFMRSEGGIWASEPGAMRTKARALERIAQETGQAPVMAYSAMSAQAGDFSRMMSDAVMGQLRPSMANRIDPAAVERYDNFVRSRIDENWPGILSPNASEYVANMTGTRRRELWQEMDKGVYRDAGFPDVGMARIAITDPRLLGAQPFDTGLTMGRVDPRFELTETSPDIHATYGTQVGGEYIGGLLDTVPGDIVWRDFFNARRAAGASTASDQRAFMMTPSINQRVDQQMVDEISRYLESLRR